MTILIFAIIAVVVLRALLSIPAKCVRQKSKAALRVMTVADIPDVINADDPRRAQYLALMKIRVPKTHD